MQLILQNRLTVNVINEQIVLFGYDDSEIMLSAYRKALLNFPVVQAILRI